MVDRTKLTNSFEFVTLASQRAKQLLKGCTPKVEGEQKAVKTAQKEVAAGVVRKVDSEV